MIASRWGAAAGLAIAGVLLVAPAARAGDEKSGSAGSHGHEAGASSSSSTGAGGSEARGTGMGGTSTGARPGEVTGAPGAPGGTSEKEQRAEAGAAQGNEVTGKIEQYDRVNRMLSLAGSDRKLKVTDDTQVFRDGDRVSPGQLMEGEEVRASFTGSGETLEVVRIDVTGAPGSTGTGATTPPAKGGSPKGTAAGTSSEVGSGSTGTTKTK